MKGSDSKRVLIVEAQFYQEFADQMYTGAAAVLDAAGCAYDRLAVPGSFELPGAIRLALDISADGHPHSGYDGFIALGCVIQGETDHYDHICREASRGLMDLVLLHGIALGFGVLTCQTIEQARARAAVDGMNKGADAAEACLRMIEVRRHFAGVLVR